jgi:hypothetical protein
MWHRHFSYGSAQRRKFNADAHIAGESAEMSYRRTKRANNFPAMSDSADSLEHCPAAAAVLNKS